MTGSPRSDADPFGTAGLREAVLTAWRASPARFREDANTEEDHARGYYRDRVLVDLAQNAADAAVQAGSPGRLLISLETDGRPRLVVANTGTPLDTAGVAALASMRASAKRPPAASDQSLGVVGRFGVGFAAVRAVADEIEVRSTTGTVRFSLEATRALLASADGQLAAEVARRGDALPVLRLPLPGDRGPDQSADGYDTAVVAWLRDDEAVAAVLAQLDEVGDAMLLGLPGLVEIVVQTPAGPRRVADVADRWQVRTMTGTLDPQLLADRPVEERDHARWQVTWALPRAEVLADHRAVVHAPTPTDDPCTLPALLVATFPLDPTRRRVQLDTPVTAALVAGAATAYAALAADVVAAGRDVSPLVPTGMPAGELDAALHTAVVEALRHVPVLRGPADVLVPTHAVALGAPAGHDQPLVEALARRIGSLVGLPRGGTSTLRVLGVRVLSLDEAIEALSITSRPGAAPVWDQAEPVEPKATDAAGWTDLYDALAPLLADQSEALAGLPVPLADGRVVRGARGAVVLDEVVGALSRRAMEALGRWGLRVVHPDAAHRVLERLGAARGDGLALLASPQVRTAIVDLQDDAPGPLGEVAAVVAELVALALPDQLPSVLGLVELPAADGDQVPAHGLVLPGSVAQHLFDDQVLPPVHADVVDLLGEPVLQALGVRCGPVVVQVSDVVAEPAVTDDDPADITSNLDAWPQYLTWLSDRFGPGAPVGDLRAVADLDAVADGAWPDLLAVVCADRDLRAALVEPVRGPGATAPSYTAWYLMRADLGLGRPFALHDDVLPGWLGPVPAVLAGTDDQVRRAVGGIGDLSELDLSGWAHVLCAVAPGTVVDLPRAVEVWRALATLAAIPAGPDAPGPVPDELVRLPALVAPDRAEMVPLASAVVADDPMWCQRTDLGPLLVVPVLAAPAVAELLDLPLASDLADGRIDTAGDREPVPPAATTLVAADVWYLHDNLTTDGHAVDWWVSDRTVHAVHLAGLAAGLAHLCGRWSARWAIEATLLDPTRAPEALLDQAVVPEVTED